MCLIPAITEPIEYVTEGTISVVNEDIVVLEKSLNEAKDLANPYWERRKTDSFVEKQMSIFRSIRILYGIELKNKLTYQYNAQHVTNAWLKFYEIASEFNWAQYLTESIGPTKAITAFYNAEYPGAGIFAMNHYFMTHFPKLNHDWYASSLLDSTKNDVFDDEFMLYELNRKRWLMSDTNNGDVTNINNILDFEKRIKKVMVYTSDAGIDVTSNFNAQEEDTLFIHMGAGICALLTLDIGGVMLLKQYTRFLPLSQTLIAMYATVFDKFYLHKPVTSKDNGSEIYLVGLGFRGIDDNLRSILLEKLKNKDKSPLFNMNKANMEKAQSTFDAIYSFTTLITNYQIETIKKNYEILATVIDDEIKMNMLKNDYKSIKYVLSKHWITMTKIKKLNKDKYLEAKQQNIKPRTTTFKNHRVKKSYHLRNRH